MTSTLHLGRRPVPATAHAAALSAAEQRSHLPGRVLTPNPAVAELLHQPVEKLLGKSCSANLPPEDAPAFAEYLLLMAAAPEAPGLQRMRLDGSQETRYLHYPQRRAHADPARA